MQGNLEARGRNDGRLSWYPVDGNQKSGKLTSWGWWFLFPLFYRVLSPSQVVGNGISEASTVRIQFPQIDLFFCWGQTGTSPSSWLICTLTISIIWALAALEIRVEVTWLLALVGWEVATVVMENLPKWIRSFDRQKCERVNLFLENGIIFEGRYLNYTP